ncbi:MAG: T9SS type A sorting domain-containing protein [Ignavibacteriaceae bacterium]|nr:T9SS type A sorting domain-containing protein [Ignavibacteriaceae bacterium]
MKKLLLSFLFMIWMSVDALPQMIESFDQNLAADTTYQFYHEGAPSRIDYLVNTTDFTQGTGSGQFNFVIGAHHQWGSNAQLIKTLPDGEFWDWSATDSLSLMIKVVNPPAIPVNMVFRIHLMDKTSATGNVEQWIYEHATILDNQSSWVELKIPIKILGTDGGMNPVDSGFVIFPSSWGGGPGNNWNNQEFDWDKVSGFAIAAVTTGWAPSGNLPADSVLVRFDAFKRFGNRPVPAVIFNGIQLMGNLSVFTWGQSAMEVVNGAGPNPNSNAIKWTQGNEWGNGWTGWGLNVSPTFNLAGAWQVDSVKFKLKCPAGTGALRVQFEGGGGKKGLVFTPTGDDQWHSYKFALRDFVFQDNTTFFDSSNVNVAQIMAEASGVAGTVIWMTDWWTGSPNFDVIAPVAPQQVAAFAGTYQNVVTWQDVPNETGEKYDIFYSKQPITDINAPGVEVVKLGVPENSQLIEHLLLAPNTDQSVTYYYAVMCKDFAGNSSVLSQNSQSVTNTAKGRPTISLAAPTNTFVADGNLQEWAGITPFRMFPSDGTGFVVTNTTISGDNDLSALGYVAADNQFLYVAFDVNDDIIVKNTQPQSYLNDGADIYLGLYNWHGFPHTSYRRGAEPDYHLRFAWNRVIIDNLGVDSLVGTGVDYYWEEKFPSGYVVEFRVRWTDLAVPGNDEVFTPVEGYRIPIDFSFNDADATGSREGILTYSPYNEDQSWNNVSRWLYTWIGNKWEPTDVDDDNMSPDKYALSQNYPNPFNPSTSIKYAIEKPGMVSLKVYDVLGREIATLVNQEQTTGVYTIQFDASALSSGIYFYKLESGSFSQVNKMMLIK